MNPTIYVVNCIFYYDIHLGSVISSGFHLMKLNFCQNILT